MSISAKLTTQRAGPGAPALFEAVTQRASLSDQVATQLIIALRTGRLQPGQPLREVALATQFAVSRGVVREALKSLAGAGLIEYKTNLGATVRQLSLPEVTDLYEVRIAHEALAIRAIRSRKPDLTPLYAHLERMRIAGSQQDPASVSVVEAEFHLELVRLSQNRILYEAAERLWHITCSALALDNARYPDLALIYTEHVDLLKAITARHALSLAQMDATLRRHIMSSLKTYKWDGK